MKPLYLVLGLIVLAGTACSKTYDAPPIIERCGSPDGRLSSFAQIVDGQPHWTIHYSGHQYFIYASQLSASAPITFTDEHVTQYKCDKIGRLEQRESLRTITLRDGDMNVLYSGQVKCLSETAAGADLLPEHDNLCHGN